MWPQFSIYCQCSEFLVPHAYLILKNEREWCRRMACPKNLSEFIDVYARLVHWIIFDARPPTLLCSYAIVATRHRFVISSSVFCFSCLCVRYEYQHTTTRQLLCRFACWARPQCKCIQNWPPQVMLSNKVVTTVIQATTFSTTRDEHINELFSITHCLVCFSYLSDNARRQAPPTCG